MWQRCSALDSKTMCIYSSWSPLGMRSVVSLFPSGLKPLIVLITSESKGLAWFTLGVKSSSTIHRDPEYQSLFSSSYTSSLCVSSPSSPGKWFLSSLLRLIHPCFLFIYLVTGFFFFLVLLVYFYQPISLHPHAHTLSHVTPWTAVRQASLSMDFSRQEYWSGLPFPSP